MKLEKNKLKVKVCYNYYIDVCVRITMRQHWKTDTRNSLARGETEAANVKAAICRMHKISFHCATFQYQRWLVFYGISPISAEILSTKKFRFSLNMAFRAESRSLCKINIFRQKLAKSPRIQAPDY